MSVRRVRGSVRGSVRRFNSSIDAKRRLNRHSTWMFHKGEWKIVYDDGDEVTLMYSKHERVPMKDFGAEVRASMDVSHFLNSATLLVDVSEPSVDRLVNRMLDKMLDHSESQCSIAEVKASLFTHDSVHVLTKTIQGTCISEGGGFDYDQSWICALCTLPSLQQRHVAIARLKVPANMGRTSHEIRFFILILCPSKEKGTKNALETARTFATLFSSMELRQQLLDANSEEQIKMSLLRHARELADEQSSPEKKGANNHVDINSVEGGSEETVAKKRRCFISKGIRDDFWRRIPHYFSDFKDGIVGNKTIQKVISSTFFLYFACLLPSIALGVLNDNNTGGIIDVQKVIVSQTIGGLFFAFFSGQPLLILLTTAPLALYIKIIYSICEDFNLDFSAMYCCVGLWSSFFLVLYSLLDASYIMKWSTRSTEEIFELFISIAFCVDAFLDVSYNFKRYYFSEPCQKLGSNSSSLVNNNTQTAIAVGCQRESSLLFLLLMLGTLWLSVSLYNFNKTPYLQASKRQLLSDYALPFAVLLLSFIGSYVFGDVHMDEFHYYDRNPFSEIAPLWRLSLGPVFAAMGLGFSLSLLFFMDQNITSAIVNNPCNKLKKGPTFHWDLMVVAILNGFLSLYTLPWVHATLPHSPFHVRSLADVEERVDQGMVYEIIVRVRETRLTGIISHVMIGFSLFLLPHPLAHIPIPVLDGLFLYMAVTALSGNQMFDRILLLFMEQAAYPPNHYIRRVPQRKIHQFTACQVLQLAVICLVGFYPWAYIKMVFPLSLLLLLPIRHKFIPKLIESKYLEALDGEYQ